MQIRAAGAADAAAVLAIYAPVVNTTAISFEISPPSVAEMSERIVSRQPGYPWLVAEDDEGIAGYAYAGPFAPRAAYKWAVETSVYVAERARRRGIGGALYEALSGLLIAGGYRQAMAGIALPNPPSVALHEQVGFTAVGVYRAVGWKFGAWHDVGWWQRTLGDGSSSAPSDNPA